MKDINEILLNLEEDGLQYAHFLTHPDYPGYYGIWVRERTPEYVKLWLPSGPLSAYSLAFSLEVSDISFYDYMAEIFPEQVEVNLLKVLYKIDDVSNSAKWSNNFRVWKQEKTRLERAKVLEQYPWVINAPSKLF